MEDQKRRVLVKPISVRSVVIRFAIAGLVALVFVAMFTAYASRRVGTEQAIDEARRVAFVSSAGIVEPLLDDDVVDHGREALDRVDRAVRDFVLQGSLVRVKIWTEDGTIVYSDEPRLVGEQFVLGDDEQAILADGGQAAEVSDLSRPENRFESGSKLLEVYSRAETPSGTPLLVETYFRYSGVTAVGQHLWAQFAPITIGALIVLELVQIPLAWSMARRLQSSQREHERLLRHALDASDAERRRIASDLHDGVVQEFTGVSLTLAAHGRGESLEPAASTRRVRSDPVEHQVIEIAARRDLPGEPSGGGPTVRRSETYSTVSPHAASRLGSSMTSTAPRSTRRPTHCSIELHRSRSATWSAHSAATVVRVSLDVAEGHSASSSTTTVGLLDRHIERARDRWPRRTAVARRARRRSQRAARGAIGPWDGTRVQVSVPVGDRML